MMTVNQCITTLNMVRLLKIYKKILISLFVLSVVFTLSSPVVAFQTGRLELNDIFVDYSKLNRNSIEAEAEYLFYNGETAENQEDRLKFFDLALGKYQLLTKIDPSQIYPCVQLGRIYDEKKIDRLAKEYFYRATNLNSRDPYANFYFGEFFYKRNNYKRALNYYLISYNNGYNNSYDLNLKLGKTYEKLADLIKARGFYEASLKMYPENTELQEKINQINSLNYENSEYYYFIRE